MLKKKEFLCFFGAPVQPNMLNMPKSVSAHTTILMALRW